MRDGRSATPISQSAKGNLMQIKGAEASAKPGATAHQNAWQQWSHGQLMTAPGVRRDKAALSSGCKSHPATAPAGSNRSSYGGNEVAEAFG